MAELKEVFEMVTKQTEPDLDSWHDQERRQPRRARDRKIGAIGVAAAIAILAVTFAIRVAGDEGRQPAIMPSPTPAPAGVIVPEVDSTLDLAAGVLTPLPQRVIGTGDRTGSYAVSPDGRQLAFVGVAEDGSDQIFVANIDGTQVEPLTHDPAGQSSPLGPGFPAWSPDGTAIAYEGYGTTGVRNLFVVDVASGRSTQVTDESRDVFGTQFTPDGSSLVYAGGTKGHGIRTVPVTGGRPTLLVGGGGNRGDAGNGSLSPDGSLLSYAFGETSEAWPDRYIANADGSEPRKIVDGFIDCSPAGSWSPDGTRLVCIEFGGGDVYVVDVATGGLEVVAATADGAIWLDDHTLLIDV
jgi:Tol biopolymer transport system component